MRLGLLTVVFDHLSFDEALDRVVAVGLNTVEPPFATFADGHRSLVLLEAALASSSADAKVSVRADGHIVMGR
jgi:hypothetical protein